jgi:thymidylate synthase (FAD)
MEQAEKAYLRLLESGAEPEQARSVLPNSLKTEIVMTANIREWRHVLSLRCSAAAHPQMREIMLPLLEEFAKRIPVLFDDLSDKYSKTRGDILT